MAGRQHPYPAERTLSTRTAPAPSQGRPGLPQGIPQVPHAFVHRARLDAILDRSTTEALTVVVAPAGSGKTAALADWARRPERGVVWLDAGSASAPGALTAALAGPIAADAPTRRARRGTAGLLAELSERTEPHSVVVIDDAHQLPSPAWALLERVLAEAPQAVRIVVATRRDVPFGLVALELAGAVTVIRSDLLAFTDDEAAALIATHAADATTEEVLTLQSRARGWAAALVLGARTLFGSADRHAVRADLVLTQQPVLDYLLGEVFTTLPAGTRHLLLCTCDEDSLDADEAVLLSGDPAAPLALARLAADGMLVMQYGSGAAGGTRWRYHPLLREMLRRQISQVGPDHDLAVSAHARAARHFARQGPAGEALRQATSAEAPELVIDLLIEHAPALVTSGREDLLAGALRSLPEQAIQAEPGLLPATAFARLTVDDLEGAAQLTKQLRELAETRRKARLVTGIAPDSADVALSADTALLTLMTVRLGGLASTEAVDEARALVGCRSGQHGTTAGEHHPPRPISAARTGWILQELAMCELWTGDLAAATAHVAESVQVAQALGHPWLLVASLSSQSLMDLLDARFRTARSTALSALDLAAEGGHDAVHAATAELVLGQVAFYELDLDEAARRLAAFDRVPTARLDPLRSTVAGVLRARLLAEAGDVAEARILLEAMLASSGGMPDPLIWLLAYDSARWALISGDLSAAGRYTDRMRGAGGAPGSELLFEAMVADLSGEPAVAEQRLAELLAMPASSRLTVIAAMAAAYRTRRLVRAGRTAEARVALRELLTRTSSHRMMHALRTAGTPEAPIAALLRAELAQSEPHPFAAAALVAVSRHSPAYEDLSAHLPPAMVEAEHLAGSDAALVGDVAGPGSGPRIRLTRREADVLAELALGGSYTDIARNLFITENTVKTHLGSLYRKLGVERRSAALRRAREVGLL